jgi:twitching motility two-component system response regulator PilH
MMSKQRVLVVDDSPTELKLLTALLTSKGYEVETAVDGDEALEKAALSKPRLVVCDVILPKKNGFQVCRQLKTAPEFTGTKVILVTSKTQDTDRFWGLKQGADEYITKPWQDAEMLAAVAKQL